MKIGVIGLGLIGGSIFKNLVNKHEVIGVSNSVSAPNVYRDYGCLKECNLIFVCTPMNITLEILDKLNDILPPEVIVTDVCSLKGFLTQRKYNFRFIPSHPMAGTEHSGWEHSFPELFQGAKWVLTPLENNVPDELPDVIKDLGAEIVISTADEHDKAVALISNLPLIVAQALCENIKDNKLAQILAASGFRDTTRLALSNAEMANDMVNINNENINEAINALKFNLDNLMLSDYLNKAKEIKDFRQKLYS